MLTHQRQDRLPGEIGSPQRSRLVFACIAGLLLVVVTHGRPTSELVLAAQSPAKTTDTSLAGCPARKPALRVAGHFNEEFTPHPAENRFASMQRASSNKSRPAHVPTCRAKFTTICSV